MNPRVTVGLLAVLVALGAYVYFGPSAGTGGSTTPGVPGVPGGGATPTAGPPLDLWKLDEGQVQSIDVKRGDTTAGVRRAPDGWLLMPTGGPADGLRVNSLVFRLASLRATRRLDSVTNLGEYGLTEPGVVATIGMADGGSHTLKLGGKAPAESGTYTLKDDESTVYLISNAIAQDLERLVTDPPIPPPPTPQLPPGAQPPAVPQAPLETPTP